VLGEIVCGDEGQDVGLEAFQIIIVVGLDRGVLDGAVHPLGLAIGPSMVGFCQPMLDIVCDADMVEDMRTEEASAGTISVLGKVGKSHAVCR